MELLVPIINERYSGDQLKDIDLLQQSWEWNFKSFFHEKLGDRFQDLVVCIREGIMNALEYGCLNSRTKYCSLKVEFFENEQKIFIKIEDPGLGHNFKITTNLDVNSSLENTNLHLGLSIMNNLSDKFKLENNGATILLEFHLSRNGILAQNVTV